MYLPMVVHCTLTMQFAGSVWSVKYNRTLINLTAVIVFMKESRIKGQDTPRGTVAPAWWESLTWNALRFYFLSPPKCVVWIHSPTYAPSLMWHNLDIYLPPGWIQLLRDEFAQLYYFLPPGRRSMDLTQQVPSSHIVLRFLVRGISRPDLQRPSEDG